MVLALIVITVAAFGQPYGVYRYPRQMPRTIRTRPETRGSSPAPKRPESPPRSPTESAKTGGASVVSHPAIISSSGPYVVSAELAAAGDATTAVIVISASDVTLDLGGFAIRGQAASNPDCHGIAILADRVRVRNGSITGFDRENQCAISVAAGVSDFSVGDISISGCETGILLNAENSPDDPVRAGRIRDCTISGAAVGILAFPSVGIGIHGCEISGSKARHSYEGEGSGAFVQGAGFSFQDCNFSDNTHGLRLDADYSSVSNCVCAANRNMGAYVTGKANLIQSSNFSGNGIIGLNINSNGSRVENCVFSENGGHGLTLDTSQGETLRKAAIIQCSADSNATDGIVDKASGGVLIDGCHVAGNGGAGLNLQSSDVYRNCYLDPAGGVARGGIDGGGNLPAKGGAAKP